VESSAESVPVLRIPTVVMRAVIWCPLVLHEEDWAWMFQSCFASRQNGFLHERVKRQGFADSEMAAESRLRESRHVPASQQNAPVTRAESRGDVSRS
jgi:hypothetical protein